MTQRIKLQINEVRSNKAGFQHLAKLHQSLSAHVFEDIELDFSGCGWFDANMCAPLGALIAHAVENLNTVRLTGFPVKIENILAKNGFLAGFDYQQRADSFGTTIPYRRFNNTDDRFFADYLNQNMRGRGLPAMSAGLKEKFKQSILELFANAAMHAESALGVFSCGQYYPQKHLLDFSIADGGIGFRRKIFNSIGLKLNSDQAIAWALQEGNTTRTGNVPGGLGLKLIKEFMALNNGRIQIVSDRGFWEFGAQGETLGRLDLAYPGSVINIEINTADTKSYRLRSETKQ